MYDLGLMRSLGQAVVYGRDLDLLGLVPVAAVESQHVVHERIGAIGRAHGLHLGGGVFEM